MNRPTYLPRRLPWAIIPWSGPTMRTGQGIFIYLWAIRRTYLIMPRMLRSSGMLSSGRRKGPIPPKINGELKTGPMTISYRELRHPYINFFTMTRSSFQFILAIILTVSFVGGTALAQQPRFKALVVISKAKDHTRIRTCADPFLKKRGDENHFQVDFTDDSSRINEGNLKQYKVFVMLQLAPFDMSVAQQDALQKFVEQGNGWVGIHADGLAGKMVVKPERRHWQWFEDMMGGVSYSPHPKFQKGTVIIEDRTHPVTKNLPEKFEISDEWYEFDKSPRPNVHVLALADESN